MKQLIAIFFFTFSFLLAWNLSTVKNKIVVRVPAPTSEYRYVMEKLEGTIREREPQAAAIVEVYEGGKLVTYAWKRVSNE